MRIRTDNKKVMDIDYDGLILHLEYYPDGRVTWIRINGTLPHTALLDAYEYINKEVENDGD